ncbi:MAG: DUF6384 family protein [Alphaproteobacteria bacterium]
MAEVETAAPETGEKPKLDDLMLAMDVVDTIRHQDTLVQRELAQEERDDHLRKRLREIYESQGLDVSDRILSQGIEALKESRFQYDRRGDGFARLLALAWVRRRQAGLALAVIVLIVVGAIGWSAWQRAGAGREALEAKFELTETLPANLSTAGQAALDATGDAEAMRAVEDILARGEAALARSDAAAARQVLADLGELRSDLLRVYEVRIVSRPGEQTGIFRIPDANQSARNYYIIVEAVTPAGDVLTLPITNEEDGSTATVNKWAVRVPKSTFDAIAADKRADGIVDDNTLGEKKRGSLDEIFLMNVEDGRIRQW